MCGISTQFPRDQLALSLVMAGDLVASSTGETGGVGGGAGGGFGGGGGGERRQFKICDLPSPGGVTFAGDFVSGLRGVRSTTFTHWTRAKNEQGGRGGGGGGGAGGCAGEKNAD